MSPKSCCNTNNNNNRVIQTESLINNLESLNFPLSNSNSFNKIPPARPRMGVSRYKSFSDNRSPKIKPKIPPKPAMRSKSFQVRPTFLTSDLYPLSETKFHQNWNRKIWKVFMKNVDVCLSWNFNVFNYLLSLNRTEIFFKLLFILTVYFLKFTKDCKQIIFFENSFYFKLYLLPKTSISVIFERNVTGDIVFCKRLKNSIQKGLYQKSFPSFW